MRFIFDGDLHIHTYLSSCSRDPNETPERLLEYARDNCLSDLCVTDHFWDDKVAGASDWYKSQNYEHIASLLPLPKADGVRFMFGCETELDRNLTLGISRDSFDLFDFVIIPTTHLHMGGFTCRGDEDASERAGLWKSRFDWLLEQNLPFEKIGVAHLTCPLIWSGHYVDVLRLISDDDYSRLFRKAADRGIGIELNFDAPDFGSDNDEVFRPYRIAKAEGCRFYFGSDAHHPRRLAEMKPLAEAIIDRLSLEESDKFRPR